MEFFVISIIKAAIVAFVLLTTLAYLQWVERKVIAHIQVRLGPSRVGPHGLLQPLADVIKLITKRSEEHTSELQSQSNLVCRLLLEKKKKQYVRNIDTPPKLAVCTR